jgi:hypothetical protein
LAAVAEDFTQLDAAEIERRMEAVKERMRPAQLEVDRLRSERDVLATELRRRERLASMNARRDLKQAMREGTFPTLAELVGATATGSFEEYVYNLKTGGEVKLGFPDARSQTITFTDGRQVAQAKDLAESARYYEAGWDLGAPGKPGIRIHFPGTRTERLVAPEEVFARPRSG